MKFKLETIQAGRGLAALAVALFHAAVVFGLPKYGNVPGVGDGVVRLGRYGVDFFFVLSGFIIAYAHWQDIGQPQQLGRYLWRRFTRIYPIYWVYLTLFIILVLLGIGTTGIDRSPASMIQSYTLVRFSDAVLPFRVSWTLFHEILFYALFAMFILSRVLGFVIVGIWIIAGLVVLQLGLETSTNELAVAVNVINLEFLFGIAVFLLSRKLPAGHWRRYLVAGSLLLLTIVAVELYLHIGDFKLWRVLYGAAFAIIMLGLLMREQVGPLTVPPVLLRLGDASYSIYLVHTTLFTGLAKVLLATGLFALPFWLVVLVGWLAAVIIAVVLYYWIERPLTAWVRTLGAQPASTQLRP